MDDGNGCETMSKKVLSVSFNHPARQYEQADPGAGVCCWMTDNDPTADRCPVMLLMKSVDGCPVMLAS